MKIPEKISKTEEMRFWRPVRMEDIFFVSFWSLIYVMEGLLSIRFVGYLILMEVWGDGCLEMKIL